MTLIIIKVNIKTNKIMKKITKSVIKFSELPENLQKNEIFKGHKIHTYAEFHIDNSEKDELTLWLLSQYPTLKQKISFLIHIDKLTEQQTIEEVFGWLTTDNYLTDLK